MSERVVFRARRPAVISGVLFSGIAGFLLTSLMGSVAFVAARIGPRPQTLSVSLTAAAFAALIGLLIARRFWLRRTTSRFEIDDEHLHAFGALWSRTIALDRVRLLRLVDYDRKGKTHAVIVQSTGARPVGLLLPVADALELFHALRRICAQAPALGLHDDRYDAIDPIDRDASERYLARILRRKGWSMIAFGLVALVMTVVMAVQTLPGGSPGDWYRVAAFGLVSVGAIAAGSHRVHRASLPVYDDDLDEGD